MTIMRTKEGDGGEREGKGSRLRGESVRSSVHWRQKGASQVAEIPVIVDMEVTNRCNAKCYFCPRDATPHQGLMSPEVFEKGVERASACGVHPGQPLWAGRTALTGGCRLDPPVRGAGVECGMSSNGSSLDEKKAAAVLEAGVGRVFLNVGDRGNDYEEVTSSRSSAPWPTSSASWPSRVTMRGEPRAGEPPADPGAHRGHAAGLAGAGRQPVPEFDVINRGGALFVDEMQYQRMPELAEARKMLAR